MSYRSKTSTEPNLKIISYPHPTLRHLSKPVKRVDDELKKIIATMFELMYEANGVGLAANQVDLPFRLFVANTTVSPDDGEELVFINPVIKRPKGSSEKEEGCLSIPGVFAPVVRPERIAVTAFDLSGNVFNKEVDGLLARIIQHETDHLDGILFIDRLHESVRQEIEDDLVPFEQDFETLREQNTIASDTEIAGRLADLESKYC